MMELIHLSDLHYGLSDEEEANLDRVIQWIAKKHPKKPVLITGDLTDSATENQMSGLWSQLIVLAQTNPILTAPGNHDYAWKGNVLRKDGPALWERYLAKPLGWNKDHMVLKDDGLYVWKYKGLVFFSVDSGDPTDEQISARGFISERLALMLSRCLRQWNNKKRIVFLHHHPFTDGFFTKLKGSHLLLHALNHNCELLLFGHEHKYGLWENRHGIPFIVSSHKTTKKMMGDLLLVTFIEVKRKQFNHRLEVVTDG